ncbi:MAG: protease inhibitor I42 family protein [Chloroflexota bacterium]
MKKALIFGVIAALFISTLALGCTKTEPATPPMPPLNGGQEAKTIEISVDDFMAQNHLTRDVVLIRPGSLIVSLGANPTTGFTWEEAEISNPSVVTEQSHNFVAPQADSQVVGAPGKDVWVFDPQQPGTATIKMSYSRPWEGGEKDEWTLTLNVTVE